MCCIKRASRFGTECRRLEINTNIGRPKEVQSTELNIRRLMTKSIPVSPL